MKAGYKTTEFYLTLVTTVVSLLVMAGILSPTEASEIAELAVQAISGIVALGVLIGYFFSRTEVKKKQIELENGEGSIG
jgi:hypothetical protein